MAAHRPTLHSADRFWRGFARHLLSALPSMIALSVAMFLVEKAGFFQTLERASLDAFLRYERPADPNNIYIVAITNEDYKSHFEETSPLNPCTVQDLVAKVAAVRPAVIGVDLDTSSKSFSDVQCPSVPQLPEHEPAIVWALVPDENSGTHGQLHFADPRVLGRPIGEHVEAAIPTFPLDSDGLVRKYIGEFNTNIPSAASISGSKVESLPRAVAKIYKEKQGRKFKGDEETILRFTGQASPFRVIQSDEFLHNAADPSFGKPDWKELAGKIVLIGGMYDAARDRYQTPVGNLSGVELIAHAIHSDLLGGGVRETNHFLAFVLDLLAASIVVFTYYWLEPKSFRLAFWVSLLEIPVLSFLASFWAFNTQAYWFSFAPVIIGMIVDQLFETSKHHRETTRELDEALARIRELESRLSSKSESA